MLKEISARRRRACSIADICAWPCFDGYPENGGGLARYPGIAARHARIAARYNQGQPK